MNTFLQAHMADLHLQDLHDAAERARRAHVETDADSGDAHDCVWVRLADASDAAALHDLAELESTATPTGPALVAEVNGRVLAALTLRGGQAIGDPFERTSDLVELLRLRAAQLDWVERRPSLASRAVARLRGRSSEYVRAA